MRKKLLLIISLIIFILPLLGLNQLNAQVATESASISAQPVEYYLPHPGRLPDNPLYWLKMIRDRAELWLAVKPEQKAKKLLHYADKRLSAGWALVEGGKEDLGVTTITKAEKYLDRALELNEHFDENLLQKATAKHVEVLNLLKDKVGDKHQTVMSQMLERFTSLKTVEGSKVTTVVNFGTGQSDSQATVMANNALEALKQLVEINNLELGLKEYDFGVLVESVGEATNNKDKAWIYFVNGQSGQVAADQHELEDGDLVEWKYTEPSY